MLALSIVVEHGPIVSAGLVVVEMKDHARLPIWLKLGMLILWVGLAANIAFDYIHYQRITPFSILFLIALSAGYLLPRIYKWPIYTNRPSRPALISFLILSIVLIIYILIKLFLIT
jgi:hypothetical protein